MSSGYSDAEDALLLRTMALVALAAATCVVYDHITTFDEEIELVWKKKWSLVQALFIVNRYVGDVVQIYSAIIFTRFALVTNEEGCSEGFVLIGYLLVVVYVAMEGIMCYRISSIYNHDRRIIAVLVVAFTAHIVSGVVIQYVGRRNLTPVSDQGVVICMGQILPRWVYLVWLGPMVFELTVLVLSLRVGLRYYRTMRTVRDMRLRPTRNSLAYVLLRDSISFPFVGLLAALLNLLTWMSFSRYVPQITFLALSFVPCVLGCRLILNLREAYYEPFLEEVGVQDERSFELDSPVGTQGRSGSVTAAGLAGGEGPSRAQALTRTNSRGRQNPRIFGEHGIQPP